MRPVPSPASHGRSMGTAEQGSPRPLLCLPGSFCRSRSLLTRAGTCSLGQPSRGEPWETEPEAGPPLGALACRPHPEDARAPQRPSARSSSARAGWLSPERADPEQTLGSSWGSSCRCSPRLRCSLGDRVETEFEPKRLGLRCPGGAPASCLHPGNHAGSPATPTLAPPRPRGQGLCSAPTAPGPDLGRSWAGPWSPASAAGCRQPPASETPAGSSWHREAGAVWASSCSYSPGKGRPWNPRDRRPASPGQEEPGPRLGNGGSRLLELGWAARPWPGW